jgi:iron complex transport system ATP-binding protein
MILHDLNQASRYADKVMLMDQGRIAALDTAANALTEARLRDVYGVECEIVEMANSHRVIYPLHRVESALGA